MLAVAGASLIEFLEVLIVSALLGIVIRARLSFNVTPAPRDDCPGLWAPRRTHDYALECVPARWCSLTAAGLDYPRVRGLVRFGLVGR